MPKEFKTMGVINVTPDSFSDGSQFNQYDSFETQILAMEKSFDVIDIGGESTAPVNKSISAELEKERLDATLITFLKKFKKFNLTLSLDTYKIEVFEWALKEIRKVLGESHPLIFNDVSGKVDEELLELINRYKFTYVLGHNLCPERSSTSEHMKYAIKSTPMDFLESMINTFQSGLEKLSFTQNEIILDPCFGFSKSREQNHYLIANIQKLTDHFSQQFLFGISRKSFLRNTQSNEASLDVAQAILLEHLLKKTNKAPIFRLHDLNSIIGLNISKEVLTNCL